MLFAVLAATASQPIAAADYDWACPPERYAVASARLQEIKDADQADRQGGLGGDVIERDKARRQEVGALFGEGCIRSGRDHYNAALVFQHGQVPDHYYQAYLFARRASDLGEADGDWLVPRAVDRYLLNSGYKQLFGTNFTCQRDEDGEQRCCVPPVADGFTDEQRIAAGEPPIEEKLAKIAERPDVPETGFCEDDRQEPPRGLFPGIW